MNKKLQTEAVVHELEGSAFFPPKPAASALVSHPSREQQSPQTAAPTDQRPTSQSASQSVGQSTDQSTDLLTSKVVDRPKAFYITRRLDRRLDEAVRYLQDYHGIKRVDRSAIVNAILDNETMWTEESLDLLVDRVINQLTSRLIK